MVYNPGVLSGAGLVCNFWNIPIMPFCSNLILGHLCFGHCFWMVWDEVVFL